MLATDDAVTSRLREFLDHWPIGLHLTSRGVQYCASLPGLADTEHALEQLRAAQILDV